MTKPNISSIINIGQEVKYIFDTNYCLYVLSISLADGLSDFTFVQVFFHGVAVPKAFLKRSSAWAKAQDNLI